MRGAQPFQALRAVFPQVKHCVFVALRFAPMEQLQELLNTMSTRLPKGKERQDFRPRARGRRVGTTRRCTGREATETAARKGDAPSLSS